MARLKFIEHRLENWALWKDRESRGGLGFSATAAFLKQHSGDGYREIQVPILDEDASVTDQAVRSLEVTRPQLCMVLQLYYLGDTTRLTILGIARAMGVSESAVHANLASADRAIALWLSERAERMRNPVRSI